MRAVALAILVRQLTINARSSLSALCALLLVACADPDAPTAVLPTTPLGPPVNFDAFAALADPLAPARWLPGRSFLASSRAPDPVEGFDNIDWDHYQARDGDADVLLDVRGVGVLTRIWATARPRVATGDAAFDFAVIDRVSIAIEIDGRRVLGGPRGVPLGELVAGAPGAELVAGFASPWVASGRQSSGGIVLDVPLHFRERVRVLAYRGDDVLYYQIDGRLLPAASEVPAFDGVLSSSARASLTTAATLWQTPGARDERLATDETSEERLVAPGERFTIEVGSGLLARVAIEATDPSAMLDGVDVDLRIDGTAVLDARPLPYLVESAHPAPYVSALSSADARHLELAYPSALDEGATLSVVNTQSAPLAIRLTLAASPIRPASDIGVLRASCGDHRSAGDGDDIVLAEVAGRVRYAGQIIAIRTDITEWNVLEGDHEIRCDDDWLLGTGAEDYFGGAFYFWLGTFARPTTGAFGVFRSGDGAAEASLYRHRLVDGLECARRFSFHYESYAATHAIDACVFHYEYAALAGD